MRISDYGMLGGIGAVFADNVKLGYEVFKANASPHVYLVNPTALDFILFGGGMAAMLISAASPYLFPQRWNPKS